MAQGFVTTPSFKILHLLLQICSAAWFFSCFLIHQAPFKHRTCHHLYTSSAIITNVTNQAGFKAEIPISQKNLGVWANQSSWSPSVQLSSVAQLCPTLCDPMNCSMPGLPVHHHLPEFTQTHVHRVSDAIQPSYPLPAPSPSAPNPSQHQSLFQSVNSSHEVAKVLEFQL